MEIIKCEVTHISTELSTKKERKMGKKWSYPHCFWCKSVDNPKNVENCERMIGTKWKVFRTPDLMRNKKAEEITRFCIKNVFGKIGKKFGKNGYNHCQKTMEYDIITITIRFCFDRTV